jgi:hypothetical protein
VFFRCYCYWCCGLVFCALAGIASTGLLEERLRLVEEIKHGYWRYRLRRQDRKPSDLLGSDEK